MKSLLDPSFRYTPSFSTDLKHTFARVRREMRQAQGQAAACRPNVLPIKQRTAATNMMRLQIERTAL